MPGLIPARAGNTSVLNAAFKELGAHPRSRGEHINQKGKIEIETGSSPLARGTRQEDIQNPRDGGLIPARAGNTLAHFRLLPVFRAHPRSRGEHAGHVLQPQVALGSSPLARGTQPKEPAQPAPVGLIPARAGNTAVLLLENPNARAHPRSRGEHKASQSKIFFLAGSSPLARGTPRFYCEYHHRRGLIPARAGNT